MASQTDIANLALAHVGDHVITSIDDADDAAARKMKAAWDITRDAVLADHPWNFALRRASLAADLTAPAFGWQRGFTLPSDPYCLRVLAITSYEGDAGEPFKVEGRTILTDAVAPLPVTFIARVTDTELWSPSFVTAMGLRLAWSVGPGLGAAAGRVADSKAAYDEMLRDARSIDAQEGTPAPFFADDFIGSRL